MDDANSLAVVPSPTIILSNEEFQASTPSVTELVVESVSVGVFTVGEVNVRPEIVVTVAPDAISVEPIVGAEYADTV